MTLKGDVFEREFSRNPVVSQEHPPIVVTLEANFTQKVKQGAWVMKDADGLVVPYVPGEGNTPLGILLEDVDPAQSTVAQVLVHGVVVAANTFIVGESGPVTPGPEDWALFGYRIVGK